MIINPIFKNPKPTTESLRKERDRLKVQANKMLGSTSIMEVFNKYCEDVKTVGSFSYNLMVYPDLDLVSSNPNFNKKKMSEMIAELVSSPFIKKLMVTDRLNFKSDRVFTGGFHVLLVVDFENEDWEIDCWIQVSGDLFYDPIEQENLLLNISEEQTDAILLIKYQLIYRNLYNKPYSSKQVYDSVLEESIKSTEEFLQRNPM